MVFYAQFVKYAYNHRSDVGRIAVTTYLTVEREIDRRGGVIRSPRRISDRGNRCRGSG